MSAQPDLVAQWVELIHRLKQLRIIGGMSGAAFAQHQGWSQSKVSKIETGKSVPMPDDVRTWATSMGAPSGEVEELVSMALEVKMNPPDHRIMRRLYLERGARLTDSEFRWVVTRNWYVTARSAMDALESSSDVPHDSVRVHRKDSPGAKLVALDHDRFVSLNGIGRHLSYLGHEESDGTIVLTPVLEKRLDPPAED